MEIPRYSRLCSACAGSLYSTGDGSASSEAPNRPHHASLQLLRQAADCGCYICSIVLEKMTIDEKDQLSPSRTGVRSAMVEYEDTGKTPFALHFQMYREDEQYGIPLIKLEISVSFHGLYSLTKFRLVTESDAKIHRLLPRIAPECHTASSSILQLARSWYMSCHDNHPQCQLIRSPDAAKGWLPTRLLDVGLKEKGLIKLVHTHQDALDILQPYITLSYRWGTKAQKLMLLSSNMNTLQQGLPLQSFPQTFQDLAVVARSLSIRYLWIDALCIMQDSNEDWEREAPTMRYVYANTACTVAATASDDPEGGLFRQRDPNALLPGIVQAPLAVASRSPCDRYYILDKTYWDRHIFNGPLHTRGWVFQERILSPRVLHFAKGQIMWECLTEAKCETFPEGVPFHTLQKDLTPLWRVLELGKTESEQPWAEGYASTAPFDDEPQPEEVRPCSRMDEEEPHGSLEEIRGVPEHELARRRVISIWGVLVKLYSRCELTKTADKLHAFAGLAQLFQEVLGDEYVAGLWRSCLLDQMDWRVYHPTTRKSSEYRAPSWSWASLDGPVRPMGQNSYMQFLPTITGVDMDYRSPQKFGDISMARLELLGHLTKASIVCFDDRSSLHHLLVGPDKANVDAELLRDSLDVALTVGSTIWCLPFKVSVGASEFGFELFLVCLLLEPILCLTSAAYRRIGLLIVKDDSEDFDSICAFGLETISDTIEFVALQTCYSIVIM